MKSLYLLSIIYIAFGLSSCASTTNHSPAKPTKDPLSVALYTKDNHPPLPYKIIGEESVSQFNVAGVKRQEAHIRDALRQIAAAMGGDALINLKHDDRSISGTVIAYRKDGRTEV